MNNNGMRDLEDAISDEGDKTDVQSDERANDTTDAPLKCQRPRDEGCAASERGASGSRAHRQTAPPHANSAPVLLEPPSKGTALRVARRRDALDGCKQTDGRIKKRVPVQLERDKEDAGRCNGPSAGVSKTRTTRRVGTTP